MDLFLENGHLSDEGLQAIINETLNEMQRLESSEHLSFCDDCLVRYTNMLDKAELYVPTQPLLPPVKARLRQKLIKVIFSKYATAAAAIAFALTLTFAGVFSPSNFSAVAGALSLNGLFNLSSHAGQQISAPKIPDIKLPNAKASDVKLPNAKASDTKIPQKQQLHVPQQRATAKDTTQKQAEEENQNPAILVAQMENPLLQFFAPKEQAKQ